MRALRGARAHAGPVLHLAATVGVLTGTVTGAVGTLGADGVGGRPAVALPLVLLALVVLAPAADELARRRRDEVTLARVHGAPAPRLLGAVTGPPVVVAGLGAAVGVAVGAATGPGGSDAVAWGTAAGCAALLVVAVASWVAAREPLAVALVRSSRRRRPGLPDLLATVGVVVAAVVAGYAARTDDPPGGPLVLAASAVLGIAAGHVLVVGLRALTPAAVGTGRGTTALLALRRALAGDHAARTRAVVAAAVVAVAAGSGAAVADDWADRTGRLALGAAVRVPLDGSGALDALLLTRRLDPEGRWLMAAALADDRSEAERRTVWLDLERYDRVAGGFLDGAAPGVDAATDELRGGPPVRIVSGAVLDVRRAVAGPPATVTVSYLDDAGAVATAVVDLAAGATDGSVAVDACDDACVVLEVAASAEVRVVGLTLGGTDLLDTDWTVDGTSTTRGGQGGLGLGADTTATPAVDPLPVLAVGSPAWPADGPEITGVDGTPRAVRPVGTGDDGATALPLVLGAGTLADLPAALSGARGTAAAVRSLVLARADTPDDVLAALAEAGAGTPQRQASVATPGGARLAEAGARWTLAGGAALLGLLALAGGWRRRVGDAAHDEAVLRLVGVLPRDRRRAAALELLVVGVLVATATAVTGWLVVRTVVASSGLVPAGPTAIPPGDSGQVLLAVLTGLVAGTASVVAEVGVRVRAGRRAAPATLVESGR